MYKIKRRRTRIVKIGRIRIGSGHPIAIQSMLKVRTRDIGKAMAQLKCLEQSGCDIVRLAVQDRQDALAICSLKRHTRLPLVADIHFDYHLALAAIEAGADKIRLNPGNIFKSNEVGDVIAAAQNNHIPIRIGANSGSLRIKSKDTASALVKSVMDYLKIFKKSRFDDIVISLKGSDILDTIAAYKKIAGLCDYPLHLGITATGLPLDGIVKSSAGIGVLLFGGIGDTIRISLLERPEEEAEVAKLLLNSLGLRKFGPELICCPTCGRCEVDLPKKAKKFKDLLDQLGPQDKLRLKNTKIALMGCIVNGPGEAKEAALGVAFSKHKAALFQSGKVFGSVDLEEGESSLFGMLKENLGRKKKR